MPLFRHFLSLSFFSRHKERLTSLGAVFNNLRAISTAALICRTLGRDKVKQKEQNGGKDAGSRSQQAELMPGSVTGVTTSCLEYCSR